MTKKYTLTTSEETVTENPEDIIRLMKLAGLTNAQPVAEEEVTEEVEAEVYEPTEANDELDLDDFSKKSPESISKQKKSIQPTLGDNPLEYSLDENEIYEAMMEEFNEIEEVDEGKLPPGLQAYQDKKNGKKSDKEETDESIEESKPDFLDLDKDGDKEESMKKAAKDKKEKVEEDGTTVSVSRKPAVTSKPVSSTDKANADATNAASDEKLIKKAVNRKRNYNDDGIAPPSGHHNNTSNRWAESTEEDIAKNLKEAEDEIDELKEELISEDCGCGHGSDCDCGPECDCGCNSVKESTDELSIQDAVNESQERLKYLISR